MASVGTMTESPIARLNDDCLLHLLALLPVTKQIQLEQVCQRWRGLIRRTFCYAKSVNVASFMITTTPVYQTHYQQDHIALTPTALGLISHCAPYVRELSFGHQWLKISQPILDAVGASCGRLTSLDLGGCIVGGRLLPALQTLAPRLRRLILDDATFLHAHSVQDLHLLFYRLLHLKELGLANARFPLRRLVDLPTDLERLSLAQVRDLDPPTLLEFFQEHQELRCLNLSGYGRLDQEMVVELSRESELEELDLSGVSAEGEALDLRPLGGLPRLRSLLLNSVSGLDADTFATLAARLAPSLHSLQLGACKRLRSFEPLGFLGHLRELVVAGTCQICDEDLELLAENGKLEILTLISCPNITDLGILSLSKLCPLRQVTLQKCGGISNESLRTLSSCVSISLQHCQITDAGFLGLVKEAPERVQGIRELDVSYNRGVSDVGLRALHDVILLLRAKSDKGPPAEKRKRQDSEGSSAAFVDSRLTVYAHQTAASPALPDALRPLINLIL